VAADAEGRTEIVSDAAHVGAGLAAHDDLQVGGLPADHLDRRYLDASGRQVDLLAEASELVRRDAVTLEDVRHAVDGAGISTVARSFDDTLRDLPRIELDDESSKAVLCGREITLDVTLRAPLVSAHNPQGRLIAVLAPASKTRWRPKKAFPPVLS